MVFGLVEHRNADKIAGLSIPSQYDPQTLNSLNYYLRFAIALLSVSICLPVFETRPVVADDRATDVSTVRSFFESQCLDCHAGNDAAAGFQLDAEGVIGGSLHTKSYDSSALENVWRRIASRQMPPPDVDRPTENGYIAAIDAITRLLKTQQKKFPRVGRTASMRRMTRTEYRRSVENVLGIDVDVDELLPQDESSNGFDNITVDSLSTTLLNRYISAAEKISRAALGRYVGIPTGKTIRIPADRTQDKHEPGLPLGTRGGTVVKYDFPQTGEYEISLRLTRDRDEKVEGLNAEHKVDVLLDKKRIHRFTVRPPAGKADWQKDYTHSDSHLNYRFKTTAGTHSVGATFPKLSSSLLTIKRQPFDASYNRHRHPRQSPALFQISIVGPFDPKGPGETASRRMIYGSDLRKVNEYKANEQAGEMAARRVIKRIAKRAFRRKVVEPDLEIPMRLFKQARDENGFEAGIELAIASILVNPNFLFRIERDPNTEISPTSKSISPDRNGRPYKISDDELASRLSYFLWNCGPDEVLLSMADKGLASNKEMLLDETIRMMNDSRSMTLVDNFGAQWLYLRNLKSITPDLRLFPDFDDNLRDAFRKETLLLFRDVVEKDRSVLSLIDSKFTFLNERLATHYDIPKIKGSQFRKVYFDKPDQTDLMRNSQLFLTNDLSLRRGGILRHGSILTVTSYATRTSPTVRGNWILKNIIGTPPKPPPANVPNLKEKSQLNLTSVRERLAMHRDDPNCSSCHRVMDPIGFSLENYDAVGRWRNFDGTVNIDSSGILPDGNTVKNVSDLEAAILKHPEMFVSNLTEKLMTYALGRNVEHFDGPAIREIVANSAKENYRFSSIIKGIVTSQPFTMRDRAESVVGQEETEKEVGSK